MKYKDVKKWRSDNKSRMVKSFGGSCGICGYSNCKKALEFHHLDPNGKDFSPTSHIRSWQKTVVELRKCVMLCANCHREVHAGIVDIPENIKRFDESYAKKNYDKDKLSPCFVCGEPKYHKLKTCSRSCSAKLSRKVDWDNKDVVELLKIHKTYTKVGEILGVSDVAVKKRYMKVIS